LRQKKQLEKALDKSSALLDRLSTLANLSEQLVREMEFGFLFDPVRKIFSIGYQATEQKLDTGYYDLLASEARLGSFVAIAKNDVPPCTGSASRVL